MCLMQGLSGLEQKFAELSEGSSEKFAGRGRKEKLQQSHEEPQR